MVPVSDRREGWIWNKSCGGGLLVVLLQLCCLPMGTPELCRFTVGGASLHTDGDPLLELGWCPALTQLQRLGLAALVGFQVCQGEERKPQGAE